MSKTRRDTLRSIVVGAASAAMLPAAAAAGVCRIDPAILAVERARAAEAAFGAVVSRESDLDEALPVELRQSDNMHGELTIVETDDPRWIAVMRDYRAADDASQAAFHDVLAKENWPTTPLGVAAVLRLCADSYQNGAPDGDWSQAVKRMCADVLTRFANHN